MASGLSFMWTEIGDRETADYAIKMSGLPVFLLGISYLLVGAFFSDTAMVDLSAGVSLVIIGIALRSGRGWLSPIATTIVLLWALIRAAQLAPFVGLLLIVSPTAIGLLVGAALQIFLLLMTISGLRGWLWTRRQNAETEEEIFR